MKEYQPRKTETLRMTSSNSTSFDVTEMKTERSNKETCYCGEIKGNHSCCFFN